MTASTASNSLPADVWLWVYDLSQGMAAQMSTSMIGHYIEGIWHTSIVAFGKEFYFGGGIQIVRPGTSQHGQPLKKLFMGQTYIDQDTFMQYVSSLRDVYRAETYHLIEKNCNHFTNDMVGFATGGSIPREIQDLPAEILSTPFGAMMRPMIDNMFRGDRPAPAVPAANHPIDSAQLAAALQSASANATSTAPSASSNQTSMSASVASTLAVCTNTASFKSILTLYKCVVTMFTSEGCPPCRMITPTFEALASTVAQQGRARQRRSAAFVLVDVKLGSPVAMQYGIRATPTFVFFLNGSKVSEMKGANEHQLESQVYSLLSMAYPPHPHKELQVPHLERLAKSSVTYTQRTQIPAALSRIAKALQTSSSPQATFCRTTFAKGVGPFLTAVATDSSAALPPTLMPTWSKATRDVLQLVPPTDAFAAVDLLRIGILDDRVAAYLATDRTALEAVLTAMPHDADGTTTIPRALRLVALRLFTNGLARATESPLANRAWLSGGNKDDDRRPDTTTTTTTTTKQQKKDVVDGLLLNALLDADDAVRTSAAGLAFAVARVVQNGRPDWLEHAADPATTWSEAWEMDLASALLEALGREMDGDVVHRLTAALGLLLLGSAHYVTLQAVAEALDAVTTLTAKRQLVTAEAQPVLDEVMLLCRRHATPSVNRGS